MDEARLAEYQNIADELGMGKAEVGAIPKQHPNFGQVILMPLHEVQGGHYAYIFYNAFMQREEGGKLKSGDEVFEASSGTAGYAFTRLALALGFKPTIIMPEGFPEQRKKPIRDVGGTLIEVSGNDIASVMNYMPIYAESHPNSWTPDHSRKPGLIRDSLRPLAEEIIAQVESLDYVVMAIGNGASIAGIAPPLKEVFPGVKIIGEEPLASGRVYEKMYPGKYKELFGIEPGSFEHQQYGTGSTADAQFPFLDMIVRRKVLDDVHLTMHPEEMHDFKLAVQDTSKGGLLRLEPMDGDNGPFGDMKALMNKGVSFYEGHQADLYRRNLSVGNSSAACYAVADLIAGRLENSDKTILFFTYDSWDRYPVNSFRQMANLMMES
ncbi:MAG: pyridoxal-phosphate dependent enzyme [Nanoarchaeota archaeon]|nr:MAG: pyridoxal-phosphate dependent enzyme [Nanoarchaeota archaeon]